MIYYADTSWWVGYKQEDDSFHKTAVSVFDRDGEAQVLWTPWQRVEVFNALRQLERTGVLAERRSQEIIRLLEQEIRLGYWPHVEFRWMDAVRTASELSAAHGLRQPIRGMDLFHVAIALEVNCEMLLTFDADLADLADAAGIPVLEWEAA